MFGTLQSTAALARRTRSPRSVLLAFASVDTVAASSRCRTIPASVLELSWAVAHDVRVQGARRRRLRGSAASTPRPLQATVARGPLQSLSDFRLSLARLRLVRSAPPQELLRY